MSDVSARRNVASAKPDRGEPVLRTRLIRGIGECPATDWNRLAAPGLEAGERPENPFLTHDFLLALEESESVSLEIGWMPLHMLVEDAGGNLCAALPLYIKWHSRGEFVFDDAWALAFERAGGRYYPKLQSAVPFTPVSGPRVQIAPESTAERDRLIRATLKGLENVAGGLGVSSVHMSFCSEQEWTVGGAAGWLPRQNLQLAWTNDGYDSFDDFLGAFSSRKRKQVRRERRSLADSGLWFKTLEGDDIESWHWDAFWEFYRDTGERHWGVPYLTRSFFDRVHERLRRDVVLFLALDGDRPVAGALNFRGRDTLYGRYWGCRETVPFLHFELCYYRAIEYAIANRLTRVEAGAGGEHKIARGYDPARTYSLHWFAHDGLAAAVQQHVRLESEAMEASAGAIRAAGSYRQGGAGR